MSDYDYRTEARLHRRAALLEVMLSIGYEALRTAPSTGRFDGLMEAREIVRGLIDRGETQ